MLKNLIAAFRTHPGLSRLLLVVALYVSMLAAGVSAISTLLSPDVYRSTSSISLEFATNDSPAVGTSLSTADKYKLQFMNTACEVIRSGVILGKVIERLDATNSWGGHFDLERYAPRTPAVLELLKAGVRLRALTDRSLLEISVIREDAEEAARIANAIAEAYREFQQEGFGGDSTATSAMTVQLVDRATPAASPVRKAKLVKLGCGVMGGILLGLASGAVFAWIAWRFRKPPNARVGAFLPVFAISFCLVLGLAGLLAPTQLPLAILMGLLLAFVTGSVAEWWVFARANFTHAPRAIVRLLATVFVIVFCWNGLGLLFSPKLFACVSRVNLSHDRAIGVGAKASAGVPQPVDARLLKTECNVIQSAAMLDRVIESFDLGGVLGRKYSTGRRVKTRDARAFLQAALEVRPIHKTSVIKIRVLAESPHQASELASHLTGAYLRHHHQAGENGSISSAVRVTVLDSTVTAFTGTWPRILMTLTQALIQALSWAFAAGGGVACAALLVGKISRRMWLALGGSLIACVAAMLIGAFALSLTPASYTGKAVIRLDSKASDAAEGGARPLVTDIYDPLLLESQRAEIRSDEVLRKAAEKLDWKKISGRKLTTEGEELTTADVIERLRSGLLARPIPDTSLIEISAVRRDREEAAAIANAVAEAYRTHKQELAEAVPAAIHAIQAEIVGWAETPTSALLRENPLGDGMDKLGPLLGAFAIGAVAWCVAYLIARVRREKAAVTSLVEKREFRRR